MKYFWALHLLILFYFFSNLSLREKTTKKHSGHPCSGGTLFTFFYFAGKKKKNPLQKYLTCFLISVSVFAVNRNDLGSSIIIFKCTLKIYIVLVRFLTAYNTYVLVANQVMSRYKKRKLPHKVNILTMWKGPASFLDCSCFLTHNLPHL